MIGIIWKEIKRLRRDQTNTDRHGLMSWILRTQPQHLPHSCINTPSPQSFSVPYFLIVMLIKSFCNTFLILMKVVQFNSFVFLFTCFHLKLLITYQLFQLIVILIIVHLHSVFNFKYQLLIIEFSVYLNQKRKKKKIKYLIQQASRSLYFV